MQNAKMNVFFRVKKNDNQKIIKDAEVETISSLTKGSLPNSHASEENSNFEKSSLSSSRQRTKQILTKDYFNQTNLRKSKYTHFPKEQDYIKKLKRSSSPPLLSPFINFISDSNKQALFSSAPLNHNRPSLKSPLSKPFDPFSNQNEQNTLRPPAFCKHIRDISSVRKSCDETKLHEKYQSKGSVEISTIKSTKINFEENHNMIRETLKKAETLNSQIVEQPMDLSYELFQLMEKSQLLRDVNHQEEAKVALMELELLLDQ